MRRVDDTGAHDRAPMHDRKWIARPGSSGVARCATTHPAISTIVVLVSRADASP